MLWDFEWSFGKLLVCKSIMDRIILFLIPVIYQKLLQKNQFINHDQTGYDKNNVKIAQLYIYIYKIIVQKFFTE